MGLANSYPVRLTHSLQGVGRQEERRALWRTSEESRLRDQGGWARGHLAPVREFLEFRRVHEGNGERPEEQDPLEEREHVWREGPGRKELLPKHDGPEERLSSHNKLLWDIFWKGESGRTPKMKSWRLPSWSTDSISGRGSPPSWYASQQPSAKLDGEVVLN